MFELARQKIPAIIGFRWDIIDDQAAEHARIFYKYLFKEKSLEYAFLKTRTDMYNRDDKHRIWAAPILIMQVRNER